MTLERALDSGESHRYSLRPGGTAELRLVVVQDGIDVTVSILGADGERRVTVDSPTGLWGEEQLFHRAEAPLGSTVEIRSLEPHGAPGRYRLRVVPRPPPELADDRLRVAQQAATKAGQLYYDGTRESLSRALDAYRQALDAWRDLGRDREANRTLFALAVLHRQLGEPREGLPLLR